MLQKYTTTYNEHFTLANIPFGIVLAPDELAPQTASRLFGDVFLIPKLIERGWLGEFEPHVHSALLESTLNCFASLGRQVHTDVRQRLQNVLRQWESHKPQGLFECSRHIEDVAMHLPVTIGDFSDFSCSKDHVLNAGEAVLGKRELPPGFLHFPVGYGGRCSSIVPSDTKIRRPLGQFRSSEGVLFGPSRAVDFELEVACVVGKPSKYGQPVRIEDADEHIFGLVLLNDWSARDIQGLEMNPLGPFNGKSFGTTISPWIVTIDALQAFECASPKKEARVASYLQDSKSNSHYSIQLQVNIETPDSSSAVCKSRFEWMYWTLRDMIAHQTVNGCPLRAGDFLATGTVSGHEPGSHGCLLEITKGGKKPLAFAEGSTRMYLQDGDAVRLSGWAGELGSESCVGFGDCYGVLCEALDM